MIDLMAWFDEKISDFQSAKDQYVANLQARYDQGYVDGKTSVVLPDTGTGDKLFTQEDMDRVAAVAKEEKDAEYQPQLAALNEKVAALEAQVGSIPDQVAQAVAAFKADLKAKYDAQQAAEAQGESDIGKLLE